MKKIILTIIGLLSLTPSFEVNGAGVPEETDMGAYLFTFFNDATHSLFMATSRDGYEFTEGVAELPS